MASLNNGSGIWSPHQSAKRDAFFVPERRARSATARAVIEALQSDLAAWEEHRGVRQRKRREADQQKHDRMVEAVLCEAIRQALIGARGAVAVSLGKEQRSRYEPRPYKPLKALLETLSEAGLGLLNVAPGYKPETGPGRRTTFAASRKLVHHAKGLSLADFGRHAGGEPITLKQTSKKVARQLSREVADAFDILMRTGAELGDLMPYEDTAHTRRLRSEMDRINSALDEATITVAPAVVKQAIKRKAVVDPGDRWLRRGFHNGHVDMRHGGRLYGGFWMDIPKDQRRQGIFIAGEPVVELDFRAMMPRLLYAHAKRCFPASRDPYDIPPIPSECRDGVKTLFSALLYGNSALQRWPDDCAEKFPKNATFGDVLAILKRHHAPVSSFFGKLVGFKLMRLESDILVRIMLTCINEDITVLPIHDAVLCPGSTANRVEGIMLAVFKRMTGMEGAVGRTASPASPMILVRGAAVEDEHSRRPKRVASK